MKRIYNHFIIALVLIVIGCQPPKDGTKQDAKEDSIARTESVSNVNSKGEELLEKCLNAHGGLDKWNAFEAISYQLNDNGKEVYQITNLHDRRAYIKSDKYEVGYDGKVAWALPDAKEVSGASAAFYYNLDFYFVGIPFLLKDPGVNISYAGTKTIKGTSYESLKVTFGQEVGLTPEDIYYLYLNPTSYILEILTYSISYFDSNKNAINSAKVYSDYKEVQGVLMPAKMENFVWQDGAIGESKNHIRLFSDIKFLNDIPDETIFNVPEGAVTESLNPS